MAVSLPEYARAVPLNVLTAHGFGPTGRPGAKPAARLDSLRRNPEGVCAAVDTAGIIGRRLLTVLAALGGSATRVQLEFQTSSAAPGVLTSALSRLEASGLVVVFPDGSAELAPVVRGQIPGATISMADQNAIGTEALALICRAIGAKAPARKQERIDAITRTFADPQACARIREGLSADARELLDRIVRIAGPGTATPEKLGVGRYLLLGGAAPRYAFDRAPQRPETATFRELTSRGIVGMSDWQAEVWVWREAWPLVGRPFVTDWTTKPDPRKVPVDTAQTRLPAVVGVLDQAMRAWQSNPPAVLKNGDPRIGKTDIRATAKALGTTEATLDVASRLAIGIGLLLPNVVGHSGRGRHVRVEEVWRGDPTMVAAWASLAPLQRWVRLVAEWCSPRIPCGHQLLVNRHLVLWELAQLADGEGFADAGEFAAWFHHRHASLGHPQAALLCVDELRALGVVTAGSLALTELGRAALDDPLAVGAKVASESKSVVVQADLTVTAPPDLCHELMVGLDAIAALENASGALTYRLDATRITRAVQAGQSPSDIVDFLAGASAVPLPDAVVRLIHDAAAKAGSVRVIAAPTVVVVSDPADLVTACAIKALKLTKVTDTVAVTEVPLAKVRTALERKGLPPETVAGGAEKPVRSSAAEAAFAAQRAAELRAVSRGHAGGVYEHHARELAARAERLSDVSGRLDVTGPLTITPAMLDRLGAAS